MRCNLCAALAAPVLLLSAHNAEARGFLERLADRAVEKVEQNADKLVGDMTSGTANPRQERNSDDEATLAVQTAPDPASAPAASPEPKARYIDSLKTPPDVEAKKAEYNKFGEVSCNDCEGGIEFDGRPSFPFDEFSGRYNERAKRAGSWPIGHTHKWQGKASKGTLTLTSEERVDGFLCRRLEYRLERSGTSVSRPGLICFGLANSSSDVENWHEIF
ncbi:hypothetical protein [Sphingopyxis sp. JAI128]|uniref:hypothetical protein n=1 Tax=Sphingopyxis sp. JAI128 TaxID=2723066 RepID=UPI00160EFF52|nr:hypothetical protein [Sphingopyxis sp. JAI128]MBB6425312.1 hypothetical protein [Sphingopyxis sp. JAI128]